MNELPHALWSLLNTYAIPSVRLLSFVSTNIIFSHVSIPRHIRLIIGLAICIAIPTTYTHALVFKQYDLGTITVLIIHEFLVGQVLSLITACLFAGFLIAGEVIALQIGLGFASFYDPSIKGNTEIISSFFQLLASTVFITSNSLGMCLHTLYDSFEQIPIRIHETAPWALLPGLFTFSTHMFIVGLSLSLPYTTILLMVNIGLGVLNRSTPQMNLFSLGLQFNVLIGLFLLSFFIHSQSNSILSLFSVLPHWLAHIPT